MNAKNQPTAQTAFQLKGSILTLSVLQLLTIDIAAFAEQLAQVIQKNPNFFNHMPVIIDLQKLFSLNNDINFSEINLLLRKNGLVPVGITNANPQQVSAATQVGWGVLPNVKTNELPKASGTPEPAKIISQPVRSGQQIYAKNADLIVLASVSHGAEILADGNIHVYGTLRGRAIAGAEGQTQARIFCQKLEAELISIAGYYKLQEDIESANYLTHTQVFLENEQLIIALIN